MIRIVHFIIVLVFSVFFTACGSGSGAENSSSTSAIDINLTNTLIAENNQKDIEIGQFSTNKTGTFTYTLVAGDGDTDNSRFSIENTILKFQEVADYETKSSYTIRVQVSDGTQSYQKSFLINVTDEDESNIPTGTIEGFAVDNYIKNALVCIDKNQNNSCDIGENNTTTDELGAFIFRDVPLFDDMVIIAYGGKDINTSEDFPYFIKNLAANKDKNDKVILSSLNTLVTDYKLITKKDINASKEAIAYYIQSGNIENIIQDIIANQSTLNSEFLRSLKIFQMIDFLNTNNTPKESAKSFEALAKAIAQNKDAVHTDNISVVLDGVVKKIENFTAKPVFMDIPSPKVLIGNSFVLDLNFIVSPDGVPLSYELSGTDSNQFKIENGKIYFKTAPLEEGFKNIVLTAIAGNSRISKNIQIEILQDTTPLSNISLSGTAITENNEINTVIGQLSANKSGEFTYTLVSGDGSGDNGSFLIDGVSLKFKDVADYETKSSYIIRVQVSDGEQSYQKSFIISVSDVVETIPEGGGSGGGGGGGTANTAPTLTFLGISTNEDITYAFTSANFTSGFVDSDGNSLTKIKITTLPAHGTLKLNGTNITQNQEILPANFTNITYVPNANYNGTDSFVGQGHDGTTYSATATMNITIAPVNDAPTAVGTIPNQIALISGQFSYQFLSNVFSDIEGTTLNYTAKLSDNSSLPTWLTFNSATRTFSKSAASGEAGSYEISVVATDGDLTATATFSLTISDGTVTASFTSIPPTTILQNASFSYIATATATNGGKLSEFDHTIPANFTKGTVTGSGTASLSIPVTLLAPLDTLGDNMVRTHDFTFKVKENTTNATVSQSFTLTVTNVNDKPVCTNIGIYCTDERKVSYGTTKNFDFTIDDGDQSVDQEVAVSAVSNATNIATVTVSETTPNKAIQVSITGVSPGTATITVTLSDDGGTDNSGINTNTFSFPVTIRSNGWKIYEDQKTSNYQNNTVSFDGRTYAWNNTKKWYEDNTNNTILMPVIIVDGAKGAYLAGNFKGIPDGITQDGILEGHYYVNKGEFLSDTFKSQVHTAATTYTSSNGGTTTASNSNFQHDAYHNFFVSMVTTSDNGTVARHYYSDWTHTAPLFMTADNTNTSYATARNLSAYHNTSTDTANQIDSANNTTSTTTECAKMYGNGWRIPTSYEMGIETAKEMTLLVDKYFGYIPAYVGNTTDRIFSSTKNGTQNGMLALNLLSDTNDGNNNWTAIGSSTTGHLRCIYQP